MQLPAEEGAAGGTAEGAAGGAAEAHCRCSVAGRMTAGTEGTAAEDVAVGTVGGAVGRPSRGGCVFTMTWTGTRAGAGPGSAFVSGPGGT